jgi:hypothetical protein
MSVLRSTKICRQGLLFAFFFAATLGFAQDSPAPAIDTLPICSRKSPGPVFEVKPPSTEPHHRFWDRTNLLLFSGVGAMRALDYASTRNMQRRGREEILLPDEVVNNSAGFAALEAAGTATSIGLSYWMHRTGHHRLERWVSIIHISVAGFGVVRNYSLESRHVLTAP